MASERRAELFKRVDDLTKVPMVVLALAMVPLIVAPLTIDLPAGLDEIFTGLDALIWGLFAVELGVKTYLSPSRWSYLRDNWIDLAIVVLPVFRPFRLLRILRVGIFTGRALIGLRPLLFRHGLVYSLLVGATLVVFSAGLVSIVEPSSGGSIENFPDALWWAVTTVTTVGYGDKYPVSTEGRLIAAFVMFLGISLFGVITANLAAFFVEHQEDTLNAKLDDVLARLDGIEEHLRKQS